MTSDVELGDDEKALLRNAGRLWDASRDLLYTYKERHPTMEEVPEIPAWEDLPVKRRVLFTSSFVDLSYSISLLVQQVAEIEL